MSLHVIEGTWEEIKRHEAELAGRHVRLTITPRKTKPSKSSVPAKAVAKPKELHGYGMFAGLLSTEDYFREKREDTIREDRSI
jgi:hypothetical protein